MKALVRKKTLPPVKDKNTTYLLSGDNLTKKGEIKWLKIF
jgi:hypothetical protein